MPRKIKVPYKGQMMDATLVDVNQSSEYWNQYLLDDNTVIKLKAVVTEVSKIDNEYDSDGNPTYYVKSANVLTVICPDELKKRQP